MLEGLFRSQLTLLRRGFWGLRTLVFLGYYGRPEIGGRIGYQPRRQGDPGFHA